jgi:tetratricopeptide (TPR) repeat protein
LFRDLFDRICLVAIVAVLVAMVLLLGGFVGTEGDLSGPERDPALERAMQERARSAFLLETYQPVEKLITDNRAAEALLKLQEFDKTYPGEPHTMILRGAILVSQGVLNEGIAQYAAAVRSNGDYVDENSGLNRRDEITRLVDKALPKLKDALRHSDNPTTEKALKETYYLQSRLAGGCE